MEKVNEKGKVVENRADGIKRERGKSLYNNYILPELSLFNFDEIIDSDHPKMASLCGDGGTADW